MRANSEIPIFFAVDDAYVPYLATALRSLSCHLSPDRQYKAIILYTELSQSHFPRLQAHSRGNFSIELVPMRGGLETIQDRSTNWLRCDYFTLTIYFRLFIPVMFPQYNKGIYIDSDVVLNTDIGELYDTDIGDNLIGACQDSSIREVPELVSYIENAVGIPIDRYINSGVLLMNLEKLRQARMDERFLSLLNTYHFDTVAPDQDYINAMCNGKIHYLDGGWDAMPNDHNEPLKDPKLIHYNLFAKPWCYDRIQYEDYFWAHAKESGYYGEILEFKQGFTEDKKESEARCLNHLISHAFEIIPEDITFQKMYQSGVEIRL